MFDLAGSSARRNGEFAVVSEINLGVESSPREMFTEKSRVGKSRDTVPLNIFSG
jgi:hypothetical protein